MRLQDKHSQLFDECVKKINQLIDTKGVSSKFQSKAVLQVPDEQMFNLDGGRYLIEIDGKELIDNNGYTYNLFVLTLEQLCEVVDAISGEASEETQSVDLTGEEKLGLRQMINHVIDKRIVNKASDLSYTELLNLKNKL